MWFVMFGLSGDGWVAVMVGARDFRCVNRLGGGWLGQRPKRGASALMSLPSSNPNSTFEDKYW